jgi:hypothetical protein
MFYHHIPHKKKVFSLFKGEKEMNSMKISCYLVLWSLKNHNRSIKIYDKRLVILKERYYHPKTFYIW